jgi:hypothetical protein
MKMETNAKRLIKILNLENKYRETLIKIIQLMSNQVSIETATIFTQRGEEMINTSIPHILEGIQKVYEEIFTEEELGEMIVWYETDTGQKLDKECGKILDMCDQVMRNACNDALNKMGVLYPNSNTEMVSRKDLN